MSRATVVARSRTTLEELASYLELSGIGAQRLDVVELDGVETSSGAVVVFPDDFRGTEPLAFIRALRRARPHALVIVITRDPDRIAPVVREETGSSRPVVLPRPSFGWAIVDLIRAHPRAAAT